MFSGVFKIALVAEVFKDGCGAMHDTIFEATGESCSEAECHLMFFNLPELIQCDALKWGIDDTEVRGDIYVHLQLKGGTDNE